ncbi:MAG: hypothetical protein JNL60_10000 [Bacteroidia bacterium]|nr:hypothetical protein [Bacteroidia bacterium]
MNNRLNILFNAGGRGLLLCFSVLFCGFIRQSDGGLITIKARYDVAYMDNIGNSYLLKDDELMKYLASGKFFARYSNLKLGTITTIDVTNPLKLLIYYRDFQKILFLDNQLSENSDVVALEKLGYEQVELVCAGANNSFWVYDKRNNELVRFNESSKKIAATGNLKQILQANITPNYMIEHNGFLYLNSPETGIYVFDIFGAFSKVISLKGLKQFQVSDDIIYYKKDGNLCSYNHRLFEEACKEVPNGKIVRDVRYVNGRLMSAFQDSVGIQKF